MAEPLPICWAVSHWAEDPWARGSWSGLLAGGTAADRAQLAEPVGDRLVLAGEAIHPAAPAMVRPILAARALGGGQLRVMARHVFPNALYALVVVATLYIATAIRTEASLSFLGLGIPPPTPSWGNILSEGRQYIKCCPWLTTFSGLAVMVAVLAFNLMGDALRDLLDPRLKGE